MCHVETMTHQQSARNEETSTELDRLAELWPAWSIWRGRHDDGRPGSWMATRRRPLTETEINNGLWPTADADTSLELEAHLITQRTTEFGP
ncbi:hypothetical protein GCM10027589_36070 [Actinocorallia lasiicapitis]